MKPICLLAALVVILNVEGVLAQTTTQTAVLGASDDPRFPLRIRGANGVMYHCMDKIERRQDGQPVRKCRADGTAPTAGLFASGTGIAGGGAIVGGMLAVVAVAAAAGDDGVGATTTTRD